MTTLLFFLFSIELGINANLLRKPNRQHAILLCDWRLNRRKKENTAETDLAFFFKKKEKNKKKLAEALLFRLWRNDSLFQGLHKLDNGGIVSIYNVRQICHAVSTTSTTVVCCCGIHPRFDVPRFRSVSVCS